MLLASVSATFGAVGPSAESLELDEIVAEVFCVQGGLHQVESDN